MRWIAVAAAFLLCSCLPQHADDARSAIGQTGMELQRLRAFILAVCQEPPLAPPESCQEAQDSFNALQAAYEALREVSP